MIQSSQCDVIADSSQLTVNTHQVLGNNKERDPFHAWDQTPLRIRDFCEHQVNDVFTQFVFACGDPHLVAAQPIPGAERVVGGVIAIGCRPGHDIGQARSGLRFGQAHRPRKTSIEFVQCEDTFLDFSAMCHE